VTNGTILKSPRHHRCCHHCPLCCHCHRLPATLVAVAINLFIAVALYLLAILVAIAIAIALLPSPSLLPANLTSPSPLPLQPSLAFFVAHQPHHHHHRPHHCHRPHCRCLPTTLVLFASLLSFSLLPPISPLFDPCCSDLPLLPSLDRDFIGVSWMPNLPGSVVVGGGAGRPTMPTTWRRRDPNHQEEP
jgi:hypothetical protein